MSLLGKYRKEEERKEGDEGKVEETVPSKTAESIPNKDRKSPIVSFSIATDLRSCLQAVRGERAINLSMWVEQKLREAVVNEFPDIAKKFLDT
jgi:hypothetical protein